MRLTFIGYQVELKTVRNKLTFLLAMSKWFKDARAGLRTLCFVLCALCFVVSVTQTKRTKYKDPSTKIKGSDHFRCS